MAEEKLQIPLTGEDYLNSRRKYWRKELAKEHKSNKTQVPSVKVTAPAAKSPTNGLTGDAYLNSRREYWRKEMAKDPGPYRNSNINSNSSFSNQTTNNTTEDSSVLPIISGLIGAGIFIAIIVSGGGPLLLLFGLFIGALLLKCMR